MEITKLSKDAELVLVNLNTYKRTYCKAFVKEGVPYVEVPLFMTRGENVELNNINKYINIVMHYLENTSWTKSHNHLKKSYSSSTYKFVIRVRL